MWVQNCYRKGTHRLKCHSRKSEVIRQLKRKVKDLKLEGLMPEKDGLIILERGLLKKCQNNRRGSR